MTDAKALILRRRARFLAATLGGITSLGTAQSAGAIEAMAIREDLPVTATFAVAEHGACVEEGAADPPRHGDVEKLLEDVKALRKNGDRDAARVMLRRARLQVLYEPALELEAEIEVQAGRIAAARALLELRMQCGGSKVSDATEAWLEDLRSRTAEVTIQNARRMKIDGLELHTAPRVLYFEPGSHSFEIETFDGVTTRREIAFAGGEKEHIEVPGEPRVCLSIAIDRNNREEAGPIGITVAPRMMIDVASPSGGPLTVGGAITPFGRFAITQSSEFRLGGIIAPSGSSRGFTMPVGATTSLRIYPGSRISIGLGGSGGWLIAPSPSRSAIGAFEATPSPYIEPHVPIGVTIGPIEIEHKIGMMFCGQEDAERSRFGASYVSLSLGVTFLPLRHSRFDD